MKHIKQFENYDDGKKYWSVSTKNPEYKISIDKLPMDKHTAEVWKHAAGTLSARNSLQATSPPSMNIFKKISLDEEIYRKIFIYTNGKEWIWLDPNSEYFNQHLSFYGYENAKFMGEITITPEEIEEYKIQQTANKYNL